MIKYSKNINVLFPVLPVINIEPVAGSSRQLRFRFNRQDPIVIRGEGALASFFTSHLYPKANDPSHQ